MMRYKGLAIGVFVVFQIGVLFYYVKFYDNAGLSQYQQSQSIRLTVNGKQVFCVPHGNNSNTATFTLSCGERLEDVSKREPTVLPANVHADIQHGDVSETHILSNLTTQESLHSVDRTAENIIRGFPDEYLYIKDNNKKLDFHCDICAIVSTSGQLLGTNAGAEIDKSSCVIRMNAAPVQGYEKDVGRRTTMRMVSFITMQAKALTKRNILDGESQPEKIVLWSSYEPRVFPKIFNAFTNLSTYYPNIEFYYASKKQMQFTDELFGRETGKARGSSGSWLSTGWFTMTMALHVCDKIHIYGMVESDYCERGNAPKVDVPYHYYDANGSTECKVYNAGETRRKGAHRYMTEKYVFRKWAEVADITFHHPSWDISQESKAKPMFLKSPMNKYGVQAAARRPPVRKTGKK